MKTPPGYIRHTVAKILVRSLDELGLALANKKHRWTQEERRDYELSIRILTQFGEPT
jgi:hypothetical protein